MKNFLLLLFSLLAMQGNCFEKLPSDYLITFGNPEAPVKIVQYFSFNCPHCLSIYREDFKKIKSKYIDTNQATWTYHPAPMDFLTVQAMDCLEKLSDREKRIFLESILDVMPTDDAKLTVCYMQKAMELFEKPVKQLSEKDYLSNTRAFQDAFLFIKQTDKINAVPTLEINEKLFLNDVPDISFIDKQMDSFLTKKTKAEEDR